MSPLTARWRSSRTCRWVAGVSQQHGTCDCSFFSTAACAASGLRQPTDITLVLLLQSTVPLTKATCSTCLLRQDKLAEQLPALQACLPPAQRYGTSCSILNGAFVVVDQTNGQEAAEEEGPLICQVVALQLPGAGEGPLEAQLTLDDDSVVRLHQVVNFTAADPQVRGARHTWQEGSLTAGAPLQIVCMMFSVHACLIAKAPTSTYLPPSPWRPLTWCSFSQGE